MKSYIKGIVTGFLISATVFAIPVVAENIDALFNNVRINVNGVDEIQWGENIELDNGETTPSSILYNGTTYLPMRKLGELSGNKIYWNGDSRTVSMTSQQKDIEVIAEKPDKNGNVWKYYTFVDTDGYNYLNVKDEARGYERVYLLANDSVRVTDNEIYFARLRDKDAYKFERYADLIKLSFDNDADTQDGTIIKSIWAVEENALVFEGDYVFYAVRTPGTGEHFDICAYNYITDSEIDTMFGGRDDAHDMSIVESNEEKTVIKYITTYFGDNKDSEHTIIFDKTTNTFSK